MRVARITPTPRPPRPDDPTPRKPPAYLYGGSAIRELGANKRIKPRSISGKDKAKANERDEDDIVRRAREVMLHLPGSNVPVNGRAKAKDKRMGSIADKAKQKSHGKGQPSFKDSVFKVPELPAKARRRQEDAGTDVFGIVEPPLTSTNGSSAKGKGKAKDTGLDGEDGESSTEATNKIVRAHLCDERVTFTEYAFRFLKSQPSVTSRMLGYRAPIQSSKISLVLCIVGLHSPL
jgi:hypothetical protein